MEVLILVLKNFNSLNFFQNNFTLDIKKFISSKNFKTKIYELDRFNRQTEI